MNEMTPKLPQEFERVLTEYYSTPAPSDEFAARLEMQLRSKVEQSHSKSRTTEGNAFMKLARTRALRAILIALLILLILTTVAYALGKVLGFIPGIGIVDQSVPMRVLAEPVTITREGLTLTVEQVVLSADQTVLVYKVEGMQMDAYENDNNGKATSDAQVNGTSSYSSLVTIPLPLDRTPENLSTSLASKTICVSDEHLLLPDGTKLPVQTGGGKGWSSGFENHDVFGPIPLEIKQATFALSCIPEVAPGKSPENWKIPLRFVPAPSDMTVLPIASAVTNGSQSEIIVEKIIETKEGYILIGKFRATGLPANFDPSGHHGVEFIDSNGKRIEASPARNILLNENKVAGEFPWEYEIQGKKLAFPLLIRIDTIYGFMQGASATFEFDTGDNPQVGQTWTIDPNVQIGGYKVHEVIITGTAVGYDFFFKNDRDVQLFDPEIVGFQIKSGGGGGDGFGRGEVHYQLQYEGAIPSGKLTVKLSNLLVLIHGLWTLTWSPPSK